MAKEFLFLYPFPAHPDEGQSNWLTSEYSGSYVKIWVNFLPNCLKNIGIKWHQDNIKQWTQQF